MPYWQAGPAFAPWAGGFFGAGLLPGLFVGSMLGGAFGGFGYPDSAYGGAEDPSGGGDFGDFGGASEVEVRFIAEAPNRTRVELEHRNLGRHGEGWEAAHDAVGGDQGWPLYLDRFGQQLTA